MPTDLQQSATLGAQSCPPAPPTLSALSLFAGCGGSDVGMRLAGIEPIWSNDVSRDACTLYERVTGTDVIHHANISKLADFPKADILCGCYPCQGYSQGGKRRSSDKRNFLYREFDRVLRATRPIAFIVENVDGMRFNQNKPLLRAQLVRFRSAGYRVEIGTLNAKDFGLAQERQRLFLVGIRTTAGFRFKFPEATHGATSSQLPYATQKDVILRYKDAPDGSYNDEPFHWYYLSRNRWRGWSDQARCIVAHWRHVQLHPDSPKLIKVSRDRWTFVDQRPARRLSYLECAALQGFGNPSAFEDSSVSVRARFRAIGNAVPPPLFGAVAGALTRQIAANRPSWM